MGSKWEQEEVLFGEQGTGSVLHFSLTCASWNLSERVFRGKCVCVRGMGGTGEKQYGSSSPYQQLRKTKL